MVLKITKEFNFEMAHALHNYHGKCANIHGHSYHLEVSVLGETVKDESSPENGMVLDFGILKHIVNDEILEAFDHALVLKDTDPVLDKLNETHQKIIKTSYQPTCENLLIDFVSRLEKRLSFPVKLHSVKLRETATSYVTWSAADNRL